MSLTKEVYRLMRNVRKLTDGQVTVESFDSENNNCQILKVVVEPNDGLYKGGRFRFSISIRESYPHSDIPAVWCDSKVYHPNIDATENKYDDFDSNVCLNILEDGTWDKSFGMGGVVLGLLFLMHNPNFDDPLSPHFSPCDTEHHIDNVSKFMKGEDVDGETYELERVGKGAEIKVDAVIQEPDMTETTTGVTTAHEEVVSETKDDETKGSNGLECAVDVTPRTDDQKLLTSEEEVERDIEYRVLSLDGELVFICESSNYVDEETNNEEDTPDTNSFTGTRTNEDNEINHEHTHTFNNAVNTFEVNTAKDETDTTNDENQDILRDETGEKNTAKENDAEVSSLEERGEMKLEEKNGYRNGLLEEASTERQRNKEHCSDVEFNENYSSLPDSFSCLNVSVHRQYRVVRRTARKLFGNIHYIGRTLLNLLYEHNRY